MSRMIPISVEGDESFSVGITGPGGTAPAVELSATETSVTTSIADNDTATWSITGDTGVDEGSTASYTISLSSILEYSFINMLEMYL